MKLKDKKIAALHMIHIAKPKLNLEVVMYVNFILNTMSQLCATYGQLIDTPYVTHP